MQRELKKVKRSNYDLRFRLEQAKQELEKREALWADVSYQHRKDKLKVETENKILREGAGPNGEALVRLAYFEVWYNSVMDSGPGNPVNSAAVREFRLQQRQAERQQVQPPLPTVHEGRASSVATRRNQAPCTDQSVRFQTLSQVPSETFTPSRRSHGDNASVSSAVSRSTMNDGRDRVLGMAL